VASIVLALAVMLSRRDLIRAAGAAFGVAAIGGCAGASSDDDPNSDGGKADGGSSQLLAGIDTIVVLCMENRSFDHYLGSRLLDEGLKVDGLTGDESNPAPDGSLVSSYRMDQFTTQDIPHTWEACHAQWNSGKNDGFVAQHAGPNQRDVMGYHVRQQLPAMYQLADAFSVCDRWHASVMGPTWPNRFFLHGGTSNGKQTNSPILGFKSIWHLLDEADVSAENYFHDVPWAATAFGKLTHNSHVENFFEKARAGKLPHYSLIDPQFFGAGANDDHPDHDPQLGQALIASIYAALAQSPQWNRCLFVVTYDEHGGFYDHVAPPKAPGESNAAFQQLGFRVPAIVAGPSVRRGATVSTLLDHVSILSTLTRRFELPSLNARVANTRDLGSCLEPASRRARPAPQLDAVEVSLSALADRPVKVGHHEEIADAADRRLIPRHLDRRAESMEITHRVLRHGERLGAVRLVD
jgi:phospholipase C